MSELIYHNSRFVYGWHFQSTGVCDMRIYSVDGGKKIIGVVSDLVKPDGQSACVGPSITNAFEYIATTARTELGFVPDVWIEFYPARGHNLAKNLARGWPPMFAEEFSTVTMKWGQSPVPWKLPGKAYSGAEWTFMSREAAEAIIGQEFVYKYCNEDVCGDE